MHCTRCTGANGCLPGVGADEPRGCGWEGHRWGQVCRQAQTHPCQSISLQQAMASLTVARGQLGQSQDGWDGLAGHTEVALELVVIAGVAGEGRTLGPGGRAQLSCDGSQGL